MELSFSQTKVGMLFESVGRGRVEVSDFHFLLRQNVGVQYRRIIIERAAAVLVYDEDAYFNLLGRYR